MVVELESEEPTELGGDASSSEDGNQSDVMTLAKRREPAAASAGGGRDAERRGNVLASRKRTVSSDTAVE